MLKGFRPVAKNLQAVLMEQTVAVRRDAGANMVSQQGQVERSKANFEESFKGKCAYLDIKGTVDGYVHGYEIPGNEFPGTER